MESPTGFQTVRRWLGLEPNIVVMLIAIVLLGMGEELWLRFVPKYLELLGASVWGIACYGAIKDFLDAVYQYPGGWFADRFGRRNALVIFMIIALLGYLFYFFSGQWGWILAGTVFVMAWTSLASPTIFAIIGDNLPPQQRAIGFGVQSIFKRIPIAIAPAMGGVLVASMGFSQGIHAGLLLTMMLTLLAMVVVLRSYREGSQPRSDKTSFVGIWRGMDGYLKKLLVADCLARWAEGIPKVFIVLYVLDVLHADPIQFGWLTTVQMIAAILVYLPVSKLSDKLNRKPFVLLTFAMFAIFPLALVNATNTAFLVIAFILGGLREIGEPARKAMIVDLAKETARARGVGMYYLIRGLVVFPASLVGGWLWTIDHQLAFYAAFGIGVAGFIFYALAGSERTRNVSQELS